MESYADVRVDQSGEVLNTLPTDFPSGQLRVGGMNVVPRIGVGFRYSYNNSNVIADPGSGSFLVDDPDVSLVTKIAIADLDIDSIRIRGYLDDFVVGSYLQVSPDGREDIASIYRISAKTGHTGWSEFTLIPIATLNGNPFASPSLARLFFYPVSPISQGGSSEIEFTAAQDIPAFSVVTSTGEIADSSNVVFHYDRVIGVTDAAVQSGFIGNAIATGEITNPAWSWSPGTKLFLNGTTLSATPPSSGFSQFIAIARSPTVIIIRIEVPIKL